MVNTKAMCVLVMLHQCLFVRAISLVDSDTSHRDITNQLHHHQAKRSTNNDNASQTNSIDQNARTYDIPPTPRASKSTLQPSSGELPEQHVHRKKHDHPAWLVYTSAVPTVVIFVVCVIIIFIKTHNQTEDSMHESVERPVPVKKKKSKQKLNQEVYDNMLAKFKDDKNRKRSFVGRKSSQIRIEGMGSRSPKSLARKHIIIGQLAEEDLQPDGNSSALGQLVQLSTHTFIGSSLVEDIEPPTWQEQAKEQAKKDLSEQLMMEYDENDALLPEDLEDVFRNFGNWEESLI
ncbi:uncharacterized protein [Clytia hemisphaerica]|uniref:Cnidarian restricted protein n=1 Tax=Clytia hemisphaerica TaxID=252671 RepID=A0A7M5V7U4_9CNID